MSPLAATLMQIAPAVLGGVARLRAVVRDWDGTPLDPDGLTGTFTVYDITMVKVPGAINLAAHRLALAEYYYDWTVPTTLPVGWYYVEFAYTVAAEADLARSQFQIVFG